MLKQFQNTMFRSAETCLHKRFVTCRISRMQRGDLPVGKPGEEKKRNMDIYTSVTNKKPKVNMEKVYSRLATLQARSESKNAGGDDEGRGSAPPSMQRKVKGKQKGGLGRGGKKRSAKAVFGGAGGPPNKKGRKKSK